MSSLDKKLNHVKCRIKMVANNIQPFVRLSYNLIIMQVQQMRHLLPQRQIPVFKKINGFLKSPQMWGQIHCKKKINQGREGCTWNMPWHDLLANQIWHIIINVLAGQKYKEALFAVSWPVCGRKRPDSHTFKVSVHFSFYKSTSLQTLPDVIYPKTSIFYIYKWQSRIQTD